MNSKQRKQHAESQRQKTDRTILDLLFDAMDLSSDNPDDLTAMGYCDKFVTALESNHPKLLQRIVKKTKEIA
jgi:hypothetical protein